ncbi:hypothetical protein MH928_16115 [Flavobacterium sp. WW92]|uniref:hypothetical protein n=1 Tax=unclassified Flavobacterium TaxID=196869 RepID=UPI0022257ECE|nr:MULTISPECIES: hypothetical protein [unclassified Flavobacterium]WDO12836.1 hypothetical protein MH928_16115 [Flavobacterium sp. WW92]
MKNLFLITLFLFASLIYATEQIPDVLKYNGKEYELRSFSPAHKYFQDRGFQPPKEAIQTTGNQKIFLFTYEIINEKLYLTDVEILLLEPNKKYPNMTDLNSKSIFKEYFPHEDKILMDVSKITVIPYGDLIEEDSWSDGYYKNYLIFEFKSGEITKKLDLSKQEYITESKKQFKLFKTTKEYKEVKKDIKAKKSVDFFNEFRPKKLQVNINQYIERHIFYKIKHIQ